MKSSLNSASTEIKHKGRNYGKKVIGIFFINETLNGTFYLKILDEDILSAIRDAIEYNNTDHIF